MKASFPSSSSFCSSVFISYSHDSSEHMARVLALSDRLRADGVDCHIDQYEMSPPEGWPRWMLKYFETVDFMLVICTKNYARRFSGQEQRRRGLGVKWEGAILTQELYGAETNNHKFIPVLFSSRHAAYIPTILRGVTFYQVDTQEGYEQLYRHLTYQPNVFKPPLGKKRLMSARNRQQKSPSRQGLQAQTAHSTGRWIIKLNATIDDIELQELQALVARLRELSGDIHLRLHRVDRGSVILVLEGSREGFERLSSLSSKRGNSPTF